VGRAIRTMGAMKLTQLFLALSIVLLVACERPEPAPVNAPEPGEVSPRRTH